MVTLEFRYRDDKKALIKVLYTNVVKFYQRKYLLQICFHSFMSFYFIVFKRPKTLLYCSRVTNEPIEDTNCRPPKNSSVHSCCCYSEKRTRLIWKTDLQVENIIKSKNIDLIFSTLGSIFDTQLSGIISLANSCTINFQAT